MVPKAPLEKPMTRHAVATLDQLDNKRPLRVQAGNEEVVLVRQGDLVHA